MVGCGGGTDETVIVVRDDVHFLTDVSGRGIPDVYYECSDGEYWGLTDEYGAYYFDPLDYRCSFELDGLIENLYIFDEIAPLNGLFYQCIPSGYSGETGDFGGDGGFNYETDDVCLIGRY